MINLTKTLLLSFLTIFLLPMQNIFAQENQTFVDLKCSQINHPYCKNLSIDLPLGFDDWGLKPYQVIEIHNNACKFLTKNQDSVMISRQLGASERIVMIQDQYNLKNGRGPKYISITCSNPKKEIPGCTNSEATNYNSQATEDDGSCILPPPPILGCTDSTAINYNILANQDDGTCQPKIEGCTDSTAINYNPSANVHKESLCEYPPAPPVYTPQDITGYIETSEVQKGATTWNIKLYTNIEDPILDISKIQTWNQFSAINTVTNGKIITITLQQFDGQRLDVECTNYEITIGKNGITTANNDKNINPITGNFTVKGCENNTNTEDPNMQNTDEENNQPKHENTIKENNFYLSLYDTDAKGKVYINLTNVIYILGFISFFLVLFFVLFGFIKNSFLGKSKR